MDGTTTARPDWAPAPDTQEHSPMPTAAPAAVPAPTMVAAPQSRSADRLIAAIRVALVIALTALVLAIAALAYVVSFEAIRAFAVETAAFPAELAWSAPLLVDSFTTAASLVILWRYLRGDHWYDPWYAWTLVALATAVSVALNVAHAPDRLAAQLFAALPPVALLGALELLMSVARCGLPHSSRSTPSATAAARSADRTATEALRRRLGPQPRPPQWPAAAALHTHGRRRRPRTLRPHLAAVTALRPQPTPDRTAAGGNGAAPHRDSRARVRELVARERATGRRLAAREVAAAAGISERRAYELLRALRAE
jgi:Protein of unknown function (DUF2637)